LLIAQAATVKTDTTPPTRHPSFCRWLQRA
jgi:hypothetical protein